MKVGVPVNYAIIKEENGSTKLTFEVEFEDGKKEFVEAYYEEINELDPKVANAAMNIIAYGLLNKKQTIDIDAKGEKFIAIYNSRGGLIRADQKTQTKPLSNKIGRKY